LTLSVGRDILEPTDKRIIEKGKPFVRMGHKAIGFFFLFSKKRRIASCQKEPIFIVNHSENVEWFFIYRKKVFKWLTALGNENTILIVIKPGR
jgi:hypothetical protein